MFVGVLYFLVWNYHLGKLEKMHKIHYSLGSSFVVEIK